MRTSVGEQSEKIADAILADLQDRGGLQNVWDEIDEETQAEIRAKWILLARRVIEISSPIEPTEAMLKAGSAAAIVVHGQLNTGDVYRAMMVAAP